MPDTCCPVGYVYVDAGGFYDDPGLGSGVILNPVAPFLDTCCILQLTATSGYRAILEPTDPMDCPCCRTGYTYSSFKAVCISDTDPRDSQSTIPCIPCVCPDPVPFECEDCGSEGERITFEHNFHSRQCDPCSPPEENPLSGCISSFLPAHYLDPETLTFKLKNKNFI